MADNDSDLLIERKMRTADLPPAAIAAFLDAVGQVRAGETGLLPESSLEPAIDLPRLGDLRQVAGPELLSQLAIIKLNGGMGTSMGLERAKSLIRVKGEETFLDFIVRQVLHLRAGRSEPAFYLMNSFSTRRDTLSYLRKYPELETGEGLDFVQNKVPKLDPRSLEPVSWPEGPDLEWCPPGHGDLYPSLSASGLVTRLLNRGVRVLFVSNSDNLGATADLRLLAYFVESDLSFLMEVAERTPADRKGGHLAKRRRDGRLILRESAQCAKEDESEFQDIARYRFFNTNNLWIRLDHLQSQLNQRGGVLPLPLIKNLKPVDPTAPNTPRVLQLESAMGAAIECFDRAGAIRVSRNRFAPVKTTSDLLALRSDAYSVADDHSLVLGPSRENKPPIVQLDPRYYQLLSEFEAAFPMGPPSLLDCDRLKCDGPLRFERGVICQGRTEFINPGSQVRTVPAGTYFDRALEWA